MILTNDPKDAEDVGGEDNQQVDDGEQTSGDGNVPWPPERLVGEEHLLDGSTHLRGEPQRSHDLTNQSSAFPCVACRGCSCRQNTGL